MIIFTPVEVLLLGSQLLVLVARTTEIFGACRTLEIRTIINYKALTNHTIRTIKPVSDSRTCRVQCFLESRCFGFNFCVHQDNTAVCELTDSDHVRSDKDLRNKLQCTFYGSESECSSNPCPRNATCQGDFLQDTRRSYRCICPAGYTGQNCELDIDECALAIHTCHVNATCSNTMGGHECVCKNGYQGNGYNCEDINECTSGTHGCSELANCTNLPGGHNCTCKSGFHGDGKVCHDINECTSGTHGCSELANCTNLPGGHNCTCKSGSHGDGKVCHDIDECASRSHGCHVNATCNNTIGGHTCSCHQGLFGDGSLFCRYPKNCDEVKTLEKPSETTGFYLLQENENLVYRFCVIGNKNGCGDGTWTLVMKIDGAKTTFQYASQLWKKEIPYNEEAMYSGLQKIETKQPAFWSKPMTKLCLGMMYEGVTNWISTSLHANSLSSAISSKASLTFGRDKWISLLEPGAQRDYCNREGFDEPSCEGFNSVISFWTNNYDHCNDCDAAISFGGTGDPVCGNFDEQPPNKRTAFCYILVQ